ncbi:universal stress protein [Mariniflexile soesokkakense]|uniref:Universal stress protein n=1 Tax=Mariniflexile soesokkakense TaxID=1343160 RepID=A0ABV0A5J5_9FLAO
MKTKDINILLPTDFSDNAWNAVVYALKMYEEQKCTFHFLHSTKIIVSQTTVRSGKLSETINKAANKDLLELKELAESSNANKNHNFQVILSSENLKDSIETAIRKCNIDLVVMGTKGATGAKEIFFGSNTVSIIKKMRLSPILIVPDEYDFVVPMQIAFATDFNRVYNHIKVSALKNLAFLHDSKIRIVHIDKEKKLSDLQQDNMEVLKNLLKQFEHSFHWMPDYSNMATEINDFIEELKIDVLVMVNYRHSFIENLIHEPVITKIGHHLKIPFLVIPD